MQPREQISQRREPESDGYRRCNSVYGCKNHPKLAEYSRKMLVALQRSSAEKKMKSDVYNEAELRSIPSGPDPLHHNGGSQKRHKNSP
ncbi:hypothetical protein V2J09_011866 [Rumex salicifolius]